MANLAKHPVSDAESAVNIYLNRLIVFVEAPEDVQIFLRLFPGRESEIRFLAPTDSPGDDDEANSNGCLAVINRVAQERHDRSNPDMCIGFVDRDIYFSRMAWDVLFDGDDDAYRADASLGDGIKPLLYWEIENYLLNPIAIDAALTDLKKSSDGIEQNLHAAITRGVALNSANCVVHTHGVQQIPDGLLLSECSDDEFETLSKEQARQRLEVLFDEPEFDAFLKRHTDFLDGFEDDERIERAMRIVPGKAILKYIEHHHRARVPLERSLARHTERCELVHDHLIDDIDSHLPN